MNKIRAPVVLIQRTPLSMKARRRIYEARFRVESPCGTGHQVLCLEQARMSFGHSLSAS